MNVHIVGSDFLISRMFHRKGYILSSLEKADITVFTGGADVSPRVYGFERHRETYSDPERDLREKEIFLRSENSLRVGICRGAQFLCAMNDGILFQDVDGHCNGPHDLIYTDEKGLDTTVKVTSTHHQMMFPGYYDEGFSKFELWGFCQISEYRDSHFQDRMKPVNPNEGPDKEIVFWPGTGCLGFQPHPEYDLQSCEDLFFLCLGRALERMKSLSGGEEKEVPASVVSGS